jgi:hypothetical protein
MTDPLLQLVLALPLALLFFLAAHHKLAEGAHFDAQLGAYRVLPEALLPVVARLLPITELAIAVLLILPVTRTAAAFAAAALVTVYALGMLINLLRGRTDIDCGCGAEPQEISYWLVLRNAILASAALLIAMPAVPRPLGVLDIALIALFAPLLAASYAMAGQLIANQSVLRHWSRDLG